MSQNKIQTLETQHTDVQTKRYPHSATSSDENPKQLTKNIQSTMSELVTHLQDPSLPANQPPSTPENIMYKNRLQEYTQKSYIQLPVYQTVNQGRPHDPKFRSTVFVDGAYYTSEYTFLNRKAAEQDVARIALESISHKPKDEGFPFIFQDTALCKSIMNEYAVKRNLDRPTYATKQANGLLPVFVSELTFNGATYTGERARNKKDAEQLAARAAILSILDSESKLTISEIIKSKTKLYATLHGATDTGGNQSSTVGLDVSLTKRKEVGANETATASKLLVSGSGYNAQAANLPFHAFKKPKSDCSSEVISPPIIFIPPISQPMLDFLPSSLSSGKKKNRRNKKRQTVEQGDTSLPVPVMALDQLPPSSVVQ